MNRHSLAGLPALFLFLLATLADAAEKTPPIAAAERLFQRLVALEQSFDPALAELYADDASIKNRRRYPSGEVREIEIPATQYKALITSAMPIARERGDTSTYSNVQYEELEPGRVRITCTRYSELKKHSSPYVLVVANRGGGRWQIVSERSESIP